MYEILNKQFKTGSTYIEYQGLIHRDKWPNFHWDLYPLVQEYYHELNPYFLYNLYQPDFFKLVDVITVRDGFGTFADYMLKNLTTIPKLGPKLFLIHPDLAPLIPDSLKDLFGCWHIVQPKQVKISEAKKVIIFGFVSEEYLGVLDKLPERIQALKDIHPDATVELWIPLRKDVFGKNEREALVIYHVMNHLKDILHNRKIKFLRGEHFFDISDFKQTYIYDLELDKMIVADNYLHYYTQSRGATVNNGSLLTPPSDSQFSFDLSIHHQIHFTPLPKVDNSLFTELLFYKRKNPNVKDLNFDHGFQNIMRTGLKKRI